MDPYDEDKHSKENVQKAAASAYSTSMLLVPIFSEQSSSTQACTSRYCSTTLLGKKALSRHSPYIHVTDRIQELYHDPKWSASSWNVIIMMELLNIQQIKEQIYKLII
jgi:hypothetical protein